MKLTKKITTEEVKRKFNERFSMLKIEFYNTKHETYSGSANENLVTENVELVELNPSFKKGELSLEKSLTVKELELGMEQKFGLHVQVFRKSGEQWMQTSITDDWTLEKQQESGESQEKFISQKS